MSRRCSATPYRRKPRTYLCFPTTLPSARAICRSVYSDGDECPTMRCRHFLAFSLLAIAPDLAQAGSSSPTGAVTALIKAYPDFLDRIEQNDLVWKDGTRMRIDDGKGAKTFDALLDDPDIKDMFLMQYPLGRHGLAPAVNFDPDRIRYAPLYKKMYGDCRAGEVLANAVNVVWLPSNHGKNLKFSKINGAAAALQRVSDELDKLPARFLTYLRTPRAPTIVVWSRVRTAKVRTVWVSQSILTA